ncbi:hypothetical protein C8T65DRAFT_237620 [Cerioporus squamosus]|nr:hypothetical protein C8T65DRAFT_237620 [Cerioporus squamosus]
MDHHIASHSEHSARLPTETCEVIITAVYDHRYDHVPGMLRTLWCCSLVCRAWRPRAQKVLFTYVTIRDPERLVRFGELLQQSPHLGAYVHKLTLRGRHHVPYSSATLFPAVLRGKLPNLEDLYIVESFSDDPLLAQPSPEEIQLPSLPSHKFLPSLLTAVSHIRQLALQNTNFSSFGELARFLNVLQDLQRLMLWDVSWTVTGQLPPCMSSKDNPQRGFLPNLKVFQCYDVPEQGRQWLISALGSSLRMLVMNFPNERSEHANADVDLRSLPNLTNLSLRIAPSMLGVNAVLHPLRSMLRTWQTSQDNPLSRTSPHDRNLKFEPWQCPNHTRQTYAELLDSVGELVESAEGILDQPTAPGSEHDGFDRQRNPCRATVVIALPKDSAKWETWWRIRAAECFPTFWKWRKLSVNAIKRVDARREWQEDYSFYYQDTPGDAELLREEYKDLQALQHTARACRRRVR